MSNVAKPVPAGSARIMSGATGTASTVHYPIGEVEVGAVVRQPSLNVQNAVYTYIQAMRALNHTHITPDVVASALNISTAAAAEALTALQNRGIRRSK
jgi:hypothetical protein